MEVNSDAESLAKHVPITVPRPSGSSMRGSRMSCQRDPTLILFPVLVDEGKEDQTLLKAYHHRLASETPFKWRFGGSLTDDSPSFERWLGSFVTFKGIRTSIAREPYSFEIFMVGVGVRTPCLLLWICLYTIYCRRRQLECQYSHPVRSTV